MGSIYNKNGKKIVTIENISLKSLNVKNYFLQIYVQKKNIKVHQTLIISLLMMGFK